VTRITSVLLVSLAGRICSTCEVYPLGWADAETYSIILQYTVFNTHDCHWHLECVHTVTCIISFYMGSLAGRPRSTCEVYSDLVIYLHSLHTTCSIHPPATLRSGVVAMYRVFSCSAGIPRRSSMFDLRGLLVYSDLRPSAHTFTLAGRYCSTCDIFAIITHYMFNTHDSTCRSGVFNLPVTSIFTLHDTHCCHILSTVLSCLYPFNYLS
jgi:hypothetical protein